MTPARAGRRRPALLLLLVAAVACLLLAAAAGAVPVPPAELPGILASRLPLIGDGVPRYWEEIHSRIIWNIRLPRVVLAGVVGSSLALAGATFQGLFRNPMADPYIIGLSSGAALGAAVAFLLRASFPWLGTFSVPAFAFAGAVLTLVLVYQLARTGGKVPVLTLILAGVAVGAFLSAIVSFLVVISGDRLTNIVYWMMGGLSGSNWPLVMLTIPYAAAGQVLILLFGRELNVLSLGEDQAHYLGLNVERVKLILLGAASLLTATAVAASGLVGFVGLIVPHMVRLVFGPDHRVLLPTAMLAGGILVTGADLAARTIIAPAEVPLGIITALLGAPFFVYLLRQARTGVSG